MHQDAQRAPEHGGLGRRKTGGPGRGQEPNRPAREDYLRAFELAGIGQVQLEPGTGRYLMANRKYCELTGYSADDLKHLTFLQVTHPQDRHADRAQLQRLTRGEIAEYTIEKRYLRKDGTTIWVQLTATLLRDAAGRPERALAMVQDISARKQAQLEALALRDRLAADLAAMTRLHEISMRFVRQGDMASLLEEIVAAAIEVTGADMGYVHLLDQASRTLRLVAHRGFPVPPVEPFRCVREGQGACGTALQRGERVVVADVSSSPAYAAADLRRAAALAGVQAAQATPLRDRAGRRVGMLATHYREPRRPDEGDLRLLDLLTRQAADLIERAQGEEALRRSHEELEARVQERTAELLHTTAELDRRAHQLACLASELTLAEQRERRRLAGVLHDHLQQLLVGGRFRVQALMRRVPGEHRPALEQVHALLDESVGLSRSLTVGLFPPVLHAGGLIPGLEWLARWVAEKHGLEVALHADPRGDERREGPKVLLFGAARELLLNVAKHAHVGHADLTLEAAGDDQVRLTVSDQGRGFDPLSLQGATVGEGGYGLFSLRERLRLLGGELEVHSEPGRGSAFVASVPRGRGAVGSPAQAEQSSTEGARRLRILLADGHLIVRRGLSLLLGSEHDMEVVGEASDGEQAVAQARQLRPDVVLMGHSMPRLDGVQATRSITAALPGARVVGLSMHDEEDGAVAMFEAGAAAYVSSSGAPQRLLEAIRQRPGAAGARP